MAKGIKRQRACLHSGKRLFVRRSHNGGKVALQIVWLVVITLVALFCMTIAAPHLVRLLNEWENDTS